MICGTFTYRNVPAGEADGMIARLQASKPSPNSVTKHPDGHGTFTVIAVFPPCGGEVEHSPGG